MTLRKLTPVLLTAFSLLCALPSAAVADPDLTVEIVAVEEGSPGTITVEVKNIGDATARPAKVGVIITAGTASVRVASPTRKLPEGKSATIAIPALLVPGLQLQAIADPEQTIKEIDEGNNASSVWKVERLGRDLVLVPVAPAEPEAQQEAEEPEPTEETAEAEQPAEQPGTLEPEEAEPEETEPEAVDEVRPPPLRQPDLSLKIVEVKSGKDGRVVVEVTNGGITSAPRSRIVLLINADGKRSEVEAVVPKLGPARTARVDLPAELWNGMRIQVAVDPRDELAEADESNNRTAVQSVQGESAPAETVTTVPDLATEILRVDPGPPLLVRAVVRNLGSLTSTATVVTLTLASGATLSQDVPPLRPGQSLEIVFEAGAPEGLVVMVDPGLAIAESDETNNRSDATLPTPAAPAQPAEPQQAPPAQPLVVAAGDSWLVGDLPVLIAPEILGDERAVPGYRPDDPPRRLAALVLANGSRIEFVENHLVFSGSEADAIALTERSGGEIVHRVARPAASGGLATWIIAVDAAGTANLPPRGTAAGAPALVSSLDALALLAIVLREQAAGAAVSVDPLVEMLDAFSGETPEAQGHNSSQWSYMRQGDPFDVNVVGAWELLDIADLPRNRIKLAILDTGFDASDLPPFVGTTGLYDVTGALKQKPFHGAAVVAAAAAIAGNGIGAAGPAGTAVNLLLLQRTTRTITDTIANLWEAVGQGALIINMSFASNVPRGTGLFYKAWDEVVVQFEADTRYLYESGILIFAGAGNDAKSVDELNADGDEAIWAAPCENQGVICVGGWSKESARRDPNSNYGEGRGETVDIYGPYKVWGPNLMNPTPDIVVENGGTSLSTPFVAGVAALVWSANPALSNTQVWDLLRNNVTMGSDGIPMVNAYRPVRQALMTLGKNFPPHLRLLEPQGGFAAALQAHPTVLAIEAIDIEDGDGCCSIAWSSDVDGPLGTGPSIDASFTGKPLGTRLVTATATDSGGLASQVSVTVDLANASPRFQIVRPEDGATLYSGFVYDFRAELRDDSAKIDLPFTDCAGVIWTSSNPADAVPFGTGCAFQGSFASAGSRTMSVSYTDAYGSTGTAHLSLTVLEPGGAGSPPIALAITNPLGGQAFNVEAHIPLSYQLNDPGAIGTMPNYEITWRLGRDATDMRVFTPLQDAQGSFIRIVDVFPERKHDGTGAGYIVHLMVNDPARPQTVSQASVTIGFLPAVK